MFTLKDRVAADSATDLDDSATIKMALTALGDYDDTDTGLSPYTDNQLFQSIQSFQKKERFKSGRHHQPRRPDAGEDQGKTCTG